MSQEEGAILAKKNNYMFMETSCERNFNVADAFEALIIITNNEMMKKKNKITVKTEEQDNAKSIKDDKVKKVKKDIEKQKGQNEEIIKNNEEEEKNEVEENEYRDINSIKINKKDVIEPNDSGGCCRKKRPTNQLQKQ